jgi:hypothetical protein
MYITNNPLPVELSVAILKSLVGTPHWEEALGIVEESLHSDEGKKLLWDWLTEGIEAPYASDVRRLMRS